jgi:two-component system KDP operon response regulator KdpE
VRVLLVLSREALVRVFALALGSDAYATRTVPAAGEAVAVAGTWRPHLVVVDMDAGGGAFLAGSEGAGAAPGRPPVLALVRRGDLRSALDAYARRADDVLMVPFSPEELVARTQGLLRRVWDGAVPLTPVIRRGELDIDLLNRSVRTAGRELYLTALELSLLYLLAANEDRVVTREEILDHLWGADFVAESNVVDRHVRSLRAHLQDDQPDPSYVATVPGRGYRFRPVAADGPAAPTGQPAGAGGRRRAAPSAAPAGVRRRRGPAAPPPDGVTPRGSP